MANFGIGTLVWAPDRFIAPDGYHLLCATHGAIFRPTDGYCVNGPCAGDSLARVPIRLEGDEVVYDFPVRT
jgi:nitrite reductase/ring-hydroxylating ferredoxin subunit